MKFKELTLILFFSTLSYGLTPKTVIKHGFIRFVQEIAEPKKENLCYNVFLGVLEEITNDYSDFDSAFELGLNKNLAQAMQPKEGHCKKAFETFQKSWASHTEKSSKVKQSSISQDRNTLVT